MSYLVPHSGKGKLLNDMLRKELGIPDGVRSFTVRFAVGEVITVNCDFMAAAPKEDEIDTTSLKDVARSWTLLTNPDGTKRAVRNKR